MITPNIIIATDSFKGSIDSLAAAKAIRRGIQQVNENTHIQCIPIADGGEGTVDALVYALNGDYTTCTVLGPLGNPVTARFGLKEKTAFIEMAEASGLDLLKKDELNPYSTTTYGTGQIIKAALDYDVTKIYIGIGGSATNDGGLGMAQALGVSFKTKGGQELGFGAKALEYLDSIDTSQLDPRLHKVSIEVLSDVKNPLYGKNGASFVYGSQKGAQNKDLPILDQLLKHYGQKLSALYGRDVNTIPGSGAAGGLGAGLLVFANATIVPGIDKMIELLELESKIQNADLVITGEGRLDQQTINGKVPIGIAALCKRYLVPLIAIVGSQSINQQTTYASGIDLIIDIINEPMTLEAAIQNVETLLIHAGITAYQAFSMIRRYANISPLK